MSKGSWVTASEPIQIDYEGIYQGSSIVFEYHYTYLLDEEHPEYDHNDLRENGPNYRPRQSSWTKTPPWLYCKKNSVRILKTNKRELDTKSDAGGYS